VPTAAKTRGFRVHREQPRALHSDPQFERQWSELVDYLDRHGLVDDDGGFFAPSASHRVAVDAVASVELW
jgi:hypothetical protein